MQKTKTGVAVVGGGYWGKNLVRNFAEIGVLKAICDSDQVKLDEYKKLYPGIKFYSAYQKLLKNKHILAVVIATPAVQHYQMIKLALEAGKDVLVEKPLALQVAQGEELAKLAEANKRLLMVGHILEYHPAVQKLSELIKGGALGKIHYIYSNRLNLGKFRTEENVLWSFAPHDISVIIRLTGELPATVATHGGAYLNCSVADVTVSNMTFKSGINAHIYVSWLHPFKEQKLVVVGSDKMAVFDDVAESKLLLYHHKTNWISRCPVAEKGKAEMVEVENLEPLKQECIHFLECIEDRSEPITNAKSALDVLKVLSASQLSLESNGKKVYLEENGLVKNEFSSNKQNSGDSLNINPQKVKDVTIAENNEVYIHPTSIVDLGAILGPGTCVWHFCHIMPEAVIGENCNFGQNVFIGKGVKVGNNVKIQNNVSVYEGVTLEDDVFCGPSCVFTNIKTPRSAYPRNKPDNYMKTLIKRGASIGANATIVCGTTIGKHTLIGAGSLVTKDIPDFAVVYGSPAVIHGWTCKCGSKLVKSRDELTCNICKTNQ